MEYVVVDISSLTKEAGIETVHDQVVSLVAQRWAKAFRCKVTIHTGLEQNPWADLQQQCDCRMACELSRQQDGMDG